VSRGVLPLRATTTAADPKRDARAARSIGVRVAGRTYRGLMNLCYVDETIEDEGFPCSWEWSVWAGWVPTSFAV
jgi:hypothetical protein